MLIVIVAQLAIVSSSPRIPPEQALAILSRMDSPSNWTNRFTCTDCDGPRVTIIASRAEHGPFGPFPDYQSALFYGASFYGTPIYRPAWYGIDRYPSRRIVTYSARVASMNDFRSRRRR